MEASEEDAPPLPGIRLSTRPFYRVFTSPPANLRYFAWRTGRGTGCLQSIVPAGFKGIIQCDGYNA